MSRSEVSFFITEWHLIWSAILGQLDCDDVRWSGGRSSEKETLPDNSDN